MAILPSKRFVAGFDDLAPNFYLTISGKSAKTGQVYDLIRPLVQSVSYEEDEDMAGMFELTLINQPDVQLGLPTNWDAVIENKAFQEGNYIDLYMGYGGAQHFMGRTEITKWLPAFGQGGPTTFTIKGFDGRHKMMLGNQYRVKKATKKKRKTFYHQADDGIVKKIAAKYGYAADTDSPETKRHKVKKKTVARVQPSDMTDWVFLRKLAAINRFDLWVEYSPSKKQFVVNFKKRRDAGQADYLFQYNGGDGSLLEAQPDFAIQEQPTDVEILYFDRRTRKIEHSIIADETKDVDVNFQSAQPGDVSVKKTMGLAARVRFTAFGQTIEALANKPFASKNEAQAFVHNWLKERERDFLILRGKVVGVETLRPRQIHQLAGLGSRLSGFYRFTQVKHNMNPGEIYTCDFLAHKVLSQDIARRKARTRTINPNVPVDGGPGRN